MSVSRFVCPRCHAHLQFISPDELSCATDGLRFQRKDGIWRFLLPERAAYFGQFIHEYETVRRAEGRASHDPLFYRNLPYRDLSEKMPADWRIRATSFDLFIKRLIEPLEQNNQILHVVDLGAGNGWLSNRLAGRGHDVCAVDLMTNDFDGLGCQRFYETAFTTVQAEFDRLPFEDGSADLVIFNASLHYSIDIQATLAEALRLFAGSRDSKLVVLDSPLYHRADSGAQMVRERESQFSRRFGFPSNAIPSENYLTYTRLEELSGNLGLQWHFQTPFYGLRWVLRPLLSRLRGNREPARFHVIIGRLAGDK